MARDPKRKFYLNGYGRHPENYTWHYEMLKKLAAINTNILDQSTGSILSPTATDSFGRLRSSLPFTTFDSNFRYGDNDKWATKTGFPNLGGTATFNPDQGLMDLEVDQRSGSICTRETYRVMPYQPGKSLFTMNSFVMDSGQLNLVQRVGNFDDSNGFFLEKNGVNTNFVKRSAVSGSVQDTIVPQSTWNKDKLDGTGPSGLTLDLTKAQILWMDFEWLGVGTVRMGFVIDGELIVAHTFEHANNIESTYITTATLPVRYQIFNSGPTNSNATLKQICSTVISEGGYELRGDSYTGGTPIGSPASFTVANTMEPIVAVKLRTDTRDGVAVLSNISITGLGNGKYYKWELRKRAITSGVSFIQAGNITEYFAGNWGTATITEPGEVVASGFFNSSNQGAPVVNLTEDFLLDFQFDRNPFTVQVGFPQYEYVLYAAVDSVSGGEGVYASMQWKEVVV